MPGPELAALIAGARVGSGVARFGSFFGGGKRRTTPPAFTNVGIGAINQVLMHFGITPLPLSGKGLVNARNRYPALIPIISKLNKGQIRLTGEDVERIRLQADQFMNQTSFENVLPRQTGKAAVIRKDRLRKLKGDVTRDFVFNAFNDLLDTPQPGDPSFVGPLQPEPKREVPFRDLARLALQFFPKARKDRFRPGFVEGGGFVREQEKEQDIVVPPGFPLKQPTTLARAIDPNILSGVG